MDESVFCSDYSQQHALDPGGTALAPDVIVLVELAEPWPKPVGKHADLAPLVGVAAEHGEQVRLLAAVPQQRVSPRLISLRPVDGGMLRSEVTIGDRPMTTCGRCSKIGRASSLRPTTPAAPY